MVKSGGFLPLSQLDNGLEVQLILIISNTDNLDYCLKAPYSSKQAFHQERFNTLIYGINTIIKCGI